MKNWAEICDLYKGQWIALEDDEQTVVAAHKELAKALTMSAEKGNSDPIVFRVPDEIVNFVGYDYSI